MSKYTICELAAACEGELHISIESGTVRYLLTDSRKFSFPGDSLFVALRGERHDGHNYLVGLFRQGVRNFLVDHIPEDSEIRSRANFIVADNTLLALQRIARMHRQRFNIPVIGITGSNGKTILKEWLYQLLQKDRAIARSPKSYNSQVGVPLSVWQIKSNHNLAVFEAGISLPGEMELLEPVISPTIGVITNIGQAHQEYFTGLEHKLIEKLKLFRHCEILIYCSDHELIDKHIEQNPIFKDKKKFRWGRSGRPDLKVTLVEQRGVNTLIIGEYQSVSCSVTIPFTDRASVENGIHAWAVLICLGYSCEYISSGMKNLLPVEMRLEQKQGINNCTIINDSYNSDPGSLEIAMDLLSQVAGAGRKTIILSDMFGTGREDGDLYSEIGTLLGRATLFRFIGIGRKIRQVERYITGNCEFYESTGDFIREYSPANFENEVILLKGSRKFGFERISMLLEEKIHATILEINLNNLIHNYNYFKSKLNPETRIMAVVKAYSYGSGSSQVAATLSHNLVDYLAVAFVDEGVSLRKAGIKVPVMVMNPDASAFRNMTDHMLEPEIFSFSGLRLFTEHIRSNGLTNYPVHIKLDTGMNRLGFTPEDTEELLKILCNNEHVRVRSLFSHLAAADEPEHDTFTLSQIDEFRETSARITGSLGYQVLRHILNSAGIERFPEAQFDMVRLGIGLYGVSSVKDSKLACVNTFKSIISQIRVVPSGQSVGYSRAHMVEGNSRIAIVPVGYADGLDRRLGNMNGLMLVNGNRVPVIGNICMDMCMLDVTGTSAREGDEVVIFGEDYSITDIADKLATIPYEVFTGISGRVKRIYVRE